MTVSRRDALKMVAATGLSGIVPPLGYAKDALPLKIDILGFALGIHVPVTVALFDSLPKLGYSPTYNRVESMRTVVQTVISGAVDMGASDAIVALSAAEAGADVKVVGLLYRSTSHVFVVNADRVKDFKDLEDPKNVVAVNSKGDIIHVMLVGPLQKRGIDLAKVNIVEVGGSGARMRGLLSGRLHAVPLHFDQASEVMRQGNYKILFAPSQEYRAWMHEVWVVKSSWLKEKKNERAVIDLLKASMTAFRHANADLAWFGAGYRKHVTLSDAKSATDESLRPLWNGLRNDVKAWPAKMEVRLDDFRELVPFYRQAGAIRGTLKIDQIIEPSLAQQAASELPA